MILFTSARERRLWLLACLAVAAVYATLGPWSGALALAPELAAGLYIGALLLGIAAVVTQGLRARPGGVELGVALAILTVYLLAFVRLALPERTHLIEYSAIAALVYAALKERARLRQISRPWLLAFAATGVLGVLDEVVQAALPHRVFDVWDIGFNLLAAALAVTSLAVLARVRQSAGG